MSQKINTLFISDVHLGTSKANADKLLEVFRNYEFDKLVILGDLIDLTSLKRKFYWKQSHFTVIQKILRMSRKGVNVVYVLGNHDHYLRSLLDERNDINVGDITITDEHVHTTISGERIYICHGDQFDGFIRLHPFLYTLGDMAYELSFKINKIYNFFRRLLGFEKWSLSAFLKTKVKNVVSFLNDFKYMAIERLRDKGGDSIMIGHTHTPAMEHMNGMNYYNTGDFCETCSYMVETVDGKIELRYA